MISMQLTIIPHAWCSFGITSQELSPDLQRVLYNADLRRLMMFVIE